MGVNWSRTTVLCVRHMNWYLSVVQRRIRSWNMMCWLRSRCFSWRTMSLFQVSGADRPCPLGDSRGPLRFGTPAESAAVTPLEPTVTAAMMPQARAASRCVAADRRSQLGLLLQKTRCGRFDSCSCRHVAPVSCCCLFCFVFNFFLLWLVTVTKQKWVGMARAAAGCVYQSQHALRFLFWLLGLKKKSYLLTINLGFFICNMSD